MQGAEAADLAGLGAVAAATGAQGLLEGAELSGRGRGRGWLLGPQGARQRALSQCCAAGRGLLQQKIWL